MSEAEVSLRLAIHLITTGKTATAVSVAIDGAQVRTGSKIYFDVSGFLRESGWSLESKSDRWQGVYSNHGYASQIEVHSNPGCGDVSATLANGNGEFIAESKKGSLSKSVSSAEYPLIREALGQLLTMETVPANAQLAVAVPAGDRFVKLAARWRNAPLLKQSGIRILTVSPSGEVDGW